MIKKKEIFFRNAFCKIFTNVYAENFTSEFKPFNIRKFFVKFRNEQKQRFIKTKICIEKMIN